MCLTPPRLGLMLVQTLLRDKYRCIFTGEYEMTFRNQADRSTPLNATNVAHIISQSLKDHITEYCPAVCDKVCDLMSHHNSMCIVLPLSLTGLGRQVP